MRVGVYVGNIQAADLGGSAAFQQSILGALVKVKTDHKIFIFYNSAKDIFQNNECVSFVNLNFKKRRFFQRRDFRNIIFNNKIFENKIELMWFLIPSDYAVKIPFALTVWDLAHRLLPYFPELTLSGWKFDEREEFYRSTITKASLVITGNNVGAKEVSQFYNFPQELIRSIAFPVSDLISNKEFDDSILAKNSLIKGDYIFYPAQFWPHKNHIRIIKALVILKKIGITLKVAFSGADKGNQEYIIEKVREYGLEDDIKFLGFVSCAELASLYKNAFAMVYASMLGPNNIPPLEAMALDCPVICSDIEGMKEQLQDAAIFFDAKDEDDLVHKIEFLYRNSLAKDTLIEKGRKLVVPLTPESYVAQMMRVVDEFVPIRECWSGDKQYTHL